MRRRGTLASHSLTSGPAAPALPLRGSYRKGVSPFVLSEAQSGKNINLAGRTKYVTNWACHLPGPFLCWDVLALNGENWNPGLVWGWEGVMGTESAEFGKMSSECGAAQLLPYRRFPRSKETGRGEATEIQMWHNTELRQLDRKWPQCRQRHFVMTHLNQEEDRLRSNGRRYSTRFRQFSKSCGVISFSGQQYLSPHEKMAFLPSKGGSHTCVHAATVWVSPPHHPPFWQLIKWLEIHKSNNWKTNIFYLILSKIRFQVPEKNYKVS